MSGVLHGVVVVPAHPVADGQGGASIEFELVRTVASGPALVAFSNVAKLIERLGAHQPWLMIPGDALLGLASSRQVDAVVLDPGPGVVECVWSARSLHHLEEANNV